MGGTVDIHSQLCGKEVVWFQFLDGIDLSVTTSLAVPVHVQFDVAFGAYFWPEVLEVDDIALLDVELLDILAVFVPQCRDDRSFTDWPALGVLKRELRMFGVVCQDQHSPWLIPVVSSFHPKVTDLEFRNKDI